MSERRGALIVFEGLDRSGKSTQCQRLIEQQRANGRQVYHTRFPDRTTATGQMINSYLSGQSQQDDHAIHLLFSANRWESAKEIQHHLKAGTDVYIDRYYYSGCVYSAAKQNPTMDLSWCRHPEVGLPRPDLCLFLNISTEETEKRGGFGSERYEKRDLQDRVRVLYDEMRQHDDESEDVVVVDAGRPVEEVAHEIASIVQDTLRRISMEQPPLRFVRAW